MLTVSPTSLLCLLIDYRSSVIHTFFTVVGILGALPDYHSAHGITIVDAPLEGGPGLGYPPKYITQALCLHRLANERLLIHYS